MHKGVQNNYPLVAILLFSLLCIRSSAATLEINSILGSRSATISNNLSQSEIAYQALILAIDGWNLNVAECWTQKLQHYDAVEWALSLPANESEGFNFPANDELPGWWNRRWLVFHTDDTIQFTLPYDIGEPLGFGIISGLRNAYSDIYPGRIFPECVIEQWGTFRVVPEPTTWLLFLSLILGYMFKCRR